MKFSKSTHIFLNQTLAGYCKNNSFDLLAILYQ
jgi:hypothetical protein